MNTQSVNSGTDSNTNMPEDDILGSVLGSLGSGESNNEGSSDQTGSTPTDQTTTSNFPSTNTQPNTAGNNNNGQQSKDFNASRGDIRDAAGNVIRGGAERRLHERVLAHEATIQRYEHNTKQLTAELEGLRAQNSAMTSAIQSFTGGGLEPQELSTAVQFMRQFKTDPVGTVKMIVAEAAAMGHTIDGLGVDTRAISSMIDNRLAPITQAYQQQMAMQQQQAQAAQRAQAEYTQLVTKYPEIRLHDDLVAAVMQDKGVSATEAYWMLRSEATARGLDFSQPLAPQVQAQNASRHNTPQRVNGRTQPGAVPLKPITGNSSWDDIVAASLPIT